MQQKKKGKEGRENICNKRAGILVIVR